MAHDVQSAFEEFVIGLRSTRVETSAAASHRQSIRDKLQKEFGLTAFFRTGSFGNGTNVRGFSDVDYFAVIPAARLEANSALTLARVAAAMRHRFPQTANIRVNGPAVQIPFGLDGAEQTEIIPVNATGSTALGYRQFEMPDGAGGWMFSAPESHNAFVDQHDLRLDGRLKPLIRCVKAWKFFRNVPVSSFYLEMFVTDLMLSESAIVYSIDLRTIFRRLIELAFCRIIDPRFPEMSLTGCSTDAQRLEAIQKCETALCRVTTAIDAEYSGQISKAFDQWDLVFDYNFPVYTRPVGRGLLSF